MDVYDNASDERDVAIEAFDGLRCILTPEVEPFSQLLRLIDGKVVF